MKSLLLRIIIVLIAGLGIYTWYKSTEQKIVYSAQEVQESESVDRQGGISVSADDLQETIDEGISEHTQPKVIKQQDLPKSVSNDVPFVAQAPLAQWDDKRFQDACEEASILMAYQWASDDQELSKEDATAALEEIFNAQKPLFGEETIDTSASDTALLMREFFGHQSTLVEDFTLEDMLQILAQGQVIIIPTDGKKLKNPYFSGDGPERHMLVVTGYDDKKKEFITNDPGTKRGKEYAYDYDLLYGSIRDYQTGIKEPITMQKKVMIAVSK